jgi:hypothetical protein
MCELPEWTPGPGVYELKTDFAKTKASKDQFVTNEKGETEEVICNVRPLGLGWFEVSVKCRYFEALAVA